MDTASIIFSVIAACASVAAILFGVASYKRNNKKDAYQDGDQDGSIRGDIKYMRNSFDDLRLDVKEVARQQSTQNERLVRCEESCKQAHKRIDRIDGVLNDGGKTDDN